MEKKSSKDTASNLFNRYIWLVDIIYRRGSITFEEINASWQRSMLNLDGDDLPLRTFHNHRKAIEQMFDITSVRLKLPDIQLVRTIRTG